MSDRDRLAGGLRELDLALNDDQVTALLTYRDLLVKWNRAFNLTAVRDPGEMIARHLLDSLAVLPHLEAGPTLDVGTGAGLPGIPLAIARPDQAFTLLDGNGKKARFVRQARRELGLDNVEVVHARVEQYRKAPSQIISRAFAALSDMLAVTGPVIAPETRVLAMKATAVERELAELPAGWTARVEPLAVPGLAETRVLVIIRRPQ
ncbi:methyltransferase GidB [Alcanivorax sp. 521-1]|uniref:Ribosomal RNA small subunit methyltransferase G n=1 Tax=Alloalcanivorax profundimaris TaxID=2735259 RepID=A0ABS0ANA4_9GAMM|nr:16S rRNA (guanine(527)-N(7))-methyltransferase RsmG [Alloalcanivorax profundimaris]MAO58412.1 16S rRNA (guanine(527)-N(7))-methyltransferase RsmG [Alcanivorax sp.]MCQ6260413.1 16S rRNA (guanine(527)-N(7))-methyltransferase RsmG [Alcanivorax sp. MM125-6]UWN50189.1 Ribosomal RNA small subunit methyltransferase G [Alcanivorax sp. ALC70]MAY10713.1 16S rRNA (guanine(527)-N(7))-methyltransferase RsmG [Alcanivorax sp.]MBF5054966.1 methyltransferase GidB [Alloalcanivorax profundimaris]|tara:strand:- start:324 stop:941 length:618 start_codon:yes stop_codon:yes gene_type:complete